MIDPNTLAASNLPVWLQTWLQTNDSESTADRMRAVTQAWQALQETPSYVEQQLARYRGFLESIAAQRER